jgi:antitoxin VapB
MNGRSQAVRLPIGYRFSGDNVYIQKTGDAVILFPKEKAWETFLEGLNGFSPDFMENGRDQGTEQTRESL